MWHDRPFSQRNKAKEKVVGVGVGGNRRQGRGGESVGQNLKKGGVRQYRGGGVFIK